MPSTSVFFYGLYMDPKVRAAKGARCTGDRSAVAENQRMLLGRKSTIVPDHGAKVWGIVAEADPGDLSALYDAEDMRAYVPVELQVVAMGGQTHSAVAYVAQADETGRLDPAYAVELATLCGRLGFPASSVSEIEAQADQPR